jgi:hypothetical protein
MNYFELGDLIKERLALKIPKNIRIMNADDLADILEKDQPAPAVHLFCISDTILEAKEDNLLIEQQWCCIVVVKNQRTPLEKLLKAGEIIAAVISALHNFKPASTQGVFYESLSGIKSPFKPIYRNGFSYHSVAFQTTFFWRV